MPEYKVLLTVKDRYGNIKEVDGGTINVDLAFTDTELNQIKDALPFESYLKKSEIDQELERFATDDELAVAASNAAKTAEVVKYQGFELVDNTEEGE